MAHEHEHHHEHAAPAAPDESAKRVIDPACGMKVDPNHAPTGEENHTELRDMSRRFWASVALSVPLLILTMGAMLPAHALPSCTTRSGSRSRQAYCIRFSACF
jgi:hypothetical protein